MKKNNLAYYTHKVVSHNHWKFKVLRKQYSWAGEGKFWALNNMIGEAHDCILDVSDEDKANQIAADLDFEIDEFRAFLAYLVTKCKLVVMIEDDCYTTENVQADLKVLTKTKEADRIRKAKVRSEF